MPSIRVLGFDGLLPRRSPTALEANQAQTATNVKLYSRELRAWRGPVLSYATALDGVKSFYRLDHPTNPIWLTWVNRNVKVSPSPVADLSDRRVYYTGTGTPKKTNHALASTLAPYPSAYYELGVPAPVSAPSAAPAAFVTATFYLNINSYAAAGDAGNITGSLTVTSARSTRTAEIAPGNTFSIPDITPPTYELSIREKMPDIVDDWSDGAGFVTDTVTLTLSPTAIAIRTLTANAPVAATEDYNTTAPTLDTRVYIYTFVSTFGALMEESAPSPPSNLVTVQTSLTVTLSGIEVAPAGLYNITHLRIYRSVTGETTDSYELVEQIAIGATSYVDGATVAQLGEVIPTIGWDTPPPDLDGLVALPFGSLAGFSGNTVYFSEPYHPHAWPSAYAVSLPHLIVGLGVFGNSVVVMTNAYPFILSGPAPDNMSQELIPLNEPCVSAGSITSDEQGVLYASPNGLVSIGNAARGVITNELFQREEWQELLPATLSGDMYSGKYFGVFTNPDQPVIVISREDTPALSYVSFDASQLWVEPTSAKLYFAKATDDAIYEADADTALLTYTWRSKRFALPKGITMSVVKVDADYAAVALGATLSLLVYADDNELITTLTLDTLSPIRLPAFRSRELEFELVGNAAVRSVIFATTVGELSSG